MNHSFDIDLAKEYGIEEAIMIENIAFWIKKNMVNNKHYIEDKYWTFNSVRAFNELFPYMNPSKINRTLKKLEKIGIIEIGKHNKAAYDQTSWYTIINEEILEKYKLIPDNCSFCKMKNGFVNLQNRSVQNEKPIPYVNTDINTDIKNKHVTCSDLKKPEKKIMLGLNPKGYPQKDEWEKFLNKNLIGVDYTPAIEKAIKNLLKTETSVAVEKILLETYKTGIETGRTVSEIATIISKGNALRAKAVKPKKEKKITEEKGQDEIIIASSLDKEKEFIQKRELEKQEVEKQKLPEVELTPELEEVLIEKVVATEGIAKTFLKKMKIKNNFMYENMLKKYL
ncbi:hypothetical protein [Cetobacterium sp. ZOR0034]|uniref:hypothetical protein n=1 Tax=Cetobacterium sp. ZOR0034 TaxID=1339239 RepID=UPI00068E65BD|nr:hypothetical protein [Cetobacterium sp. ZOR0034]